MNFYERLVAETLEEKKILFSVPVILDAAKGDITRKSYILYLEQAYHHVKHTVPLMMLTGSKLPASKEWVREALIEYVNEEKGHQEWILNDITNAGGDGELSRISQPNHATEMMVSYAYDYITRVNPMGFFGMVFVLEGTSTQLATGIAETLMSALGLPKKAFSYLLSHGSLDLEHIEFFKDLVNRIESEEDKQAIIHMAKRMFILFAEVFRSIPHKNEVRNAA